MAVGDIWEVNTYSLYVRMGPGTNYGARGGLVKGDQVTEIEMSNGNWIKHDKGGWSCTDFMINISDKSSHKITDVTNPAGPGFTQENLKEYYEESGMNSDGSFGAQVDPDTITNMKESQIFENTIQSNDTFYELDSIVGTFGLPYQFLPTTDPRMNSYESVYQTASTGIGYEYADRIVGKMPILFIAPGRPNFMTKFSEQEKEVAITRAISDFLDRDMVRNSIDDLMETEGRYYTFEYDLNGYYQYVNPMCRIAARYLELHDFSLNGKKLDNIDWSQYTIDNIKGLMESTTYMNIPFYIDSDTSVSEDFGNSVGESSLASTVNGVSDMARELMFLTGHSSEALNVDWYKAHSDVLDSMENLEDYVNGLLGNGNFLGNLLKHLNVVASGGRLIFPKIWTDSDVSRSYGVKIKLVSPDCNKLSIFLNILVPLFHLIGLVAPQSIAANPNGYTSPFLVRAMYKSFFNVDMGIITSMSVERGGNCQWTVDGLPTSIEISMTIKDLYDVLAISKTSLTTGLKYDTMANTAQMDYIANLCGINMYKPEIGRQLSMWLVNHLENNLIDVPRNVWRTINQTIGSSILNIFRKL